MEFGLLSTSGHRQNEIAASTYDEDLYEILLAEELGFAEAWVAELNIRSRRARPDVVTAANLLICKAAGLTSRLRLGTGIRNLPFLHPVQVALEATMCDHLTDGRYMLGYGGTRVAGRDHARQLGLPDEFDARAMVFEGIELIRQCWTAPEPFDFCGQFWQGRGINIQPKPLQRPHPPIAAACAGSVATLEFAARNRFIPLFGRGSDTAAGVRQMAELYMGTALASEWTPSRRSFRVAHLVFVADSVAAAKEELREGMTRQIEASKVRDPDFLRAAIPPGGTMDDVTFDYLADNGFYFIGDPDAVTEAIIDFYHQAGGFGILLFNAGIPAGSTAAREKSMRRFVTEVAPALTDLDPDLDYPLEVPTAKAEV